MEGGWPERVDGLQVAMCVRDARGEQLRGAEVSRERSGEEPIRC